MERVNSISLSKLTLWFRPFSLVAGLVIAIICAFVLMSTIQSPDTSGNHSSNAQHEFWISSNVLSPTAKYTKLNWC